MLSNIEPSKKLESITVDDNYETKTSFLNLNNSDINNINGLTINVVNENIDNKDENEISETDYINLDQLTNSSSIGESDLDKKINDEITRETHEENIIMNTLNSEISTQELNDDEIKSNIDEMNTLNSEISKQQLNDDEINTLNSEISTQQLNDDEIKSNIDEMNTNISFMSKINALYAYFFKTKNVHLSKK